MARRVNKKLIVGLTIGAIVVTAVAAVVLVKQLPETDPELLAQRARRLIEQGDVVLGAKQLVRASAVSKNPAYLTEAGEALIGDGRNPEARQVWQQALLLDPAFVPVHEKLVSQALAVARKSWRSVDSWRRVLADSKQLLNIRQSSPLGLNARGMARLRLVSEDSANQQKGEDDLIAAVGGEPDNPKYTQDLANHYLSTDRAARAQSAFDALLAESPDDPEALRYHAIFLMREKRPDDALVRLEQAKNVAPDNVDVRIALGIYWDYQKDQEKSERAFRHAIELAPDGYEAYLGLCRIFMRANAPANAVEVCQLRLDRGPVRGSGSRAWENRLLHASLLEQAVNASLAEASAKRSDKKATESLLADAQAYLNERVAELGESSATHSFRGSIAMFRGQDTTAVKDFEQALKMPGTPHPLAGRTLATLYIKQNQLGKAERTLSAIVNQFPLSAQASVDALGTWTLLANVQNRLGRPDDAIHTVDRILEHVPSHGPALLQKAKAMEQQTNSTDDPATRKFLADEIASLLRRAGADTEHGQEFNVAALILEGRLEEAETVLAKLRKDRPDDPGLLRHLFSIYNRTNRRDEAVKLIAEAAARNPENMTFQQWLITLTPDQSDADRAAKLRELLESIEDPVTRAASLSDHALRQSNLDEARKQLDDAEKLNPQAAPLLLRQFLLALRQQAWDRAETYVGRLGKLNTDGAAGRTYRGQFHLARAEAFIQANDTAGSTRQLGQAVSELRQALDEYPSNSLAQTFLGTAYLGLGRHEEARTEFEEAIKLNPNNGQAQKQLALMAYSTGDTELGDQHLAQAQRTLGQDPWVQAKVAELAERKNPAEGIKRREKLREKNPEDVDNLVGLARLYALQQQHDRALEVMNHARKLQPENPQLVLALAHLLGESGQLDPGAAVLTEWIATRPDNPTKARSLLLLARYYRRSQFAYPPKVRREQAGQAYDEAVRLAGDDVSVCIAMAQWKRVIREIDDAVMWYDKAASHADNAAQQARLRLDVAEMLYQSKRFDDAAERTEAFRRDLPDDLRGDLLAGVIDLDRGRMSQALASFNKVIENDAENANAYSRRAVLRFRQNRWTECIADLNRAKALSPDGFNYRHRILLARTLELTGRRDEAVAELNEILRAHPEAFRVVAAIIETYQRQERWSEAEALLVEYTSRFPDSADWAFRRGLLARQLGHQRDGLTWLKKAAELSAYAPAVIDAYLGALLADKAWDEAIQFTTTVLPETRRNAALIRRRLAVALAQKGNLEGAWKEIESILAGAITRRDLERIVNDFQIVHGTDRAIELVHTRHQAQPGHRGLSVLDALIAGTLGKDPATAIKQIEALLVDATEDNEKLLLHQVAGALHYRQKKYEPACKAYEAALTLRPDDIMSLNNLAFLLAEEMNQPREALPHAKHAVVITPQDANALDTLAWVHYRLDELDTAVARLNQAIQLDSNMVAAHYHLGIVHEKRGDRSDAIRSLQKAIKAAGNNHDVGFAAEAKQALRKLGVNP